MKVAINNFVRRQTKDSGKTYSKELSFDFFAKHAEKKMNNNDFTDGYRDGVRIVNLDNDYVENVLKPLYESFTDVNYHRENKFLGYAIEEMENPGEDVNRAMERIEDDLEDFNKACLETLKDITKGKMS